MTDRAITQVAPQPRAPVWADAIGRRIGPHVPLLLLAGGGYYAAAQLGLALQFPGLVLSALWPPNAVLLIAMLLTPARHWWMIGLAIIPAHLAAHAEAGIPIWRLGWQIGHNIVLAVGAAAAMRRLVGTNHPFRNPHDLTVYLVVAVLTAPAIAALLGPSTVLSLLRGAAVNGESVWHAFRVTYLSNATAFLTLVPAVVLWVSAGSGSTHRLTRARSIDVGLIAAGIFLACELAFAGDPAMPAALYALLPPLFWATARFGMLGAASTLFAITLSSVFLATDGRGAFFGTGAIDNVFRLQMFLFALTAPVLLLAALLEERASTAQALQSGSNTLRESQERIHDLVRQFTDAQDVERRRVAADAHEDVGQGLHALSLNLTLLSQRLSSESTDLATELESLQDCVLAAVRSIRDLSHSLHPEALRQVGLTQTVRGQKEFVGASWLEVALEVDANMPAVPGDTALPGWTGPRLRRLLVELARANRLRDEVLGIVSHDLRSPLNTIMVSSELLLRADRERAEGRELVRRQVDIIRRTVEQMSRLIQDLMDVALIESRRLAIVREPLCVRTLVSEVVELHRSQIEAKSLRLESSVRPGLPSVMADRGRMLQVFSNVIGNAAKFTRPGGEIVLRAERDGEQVRFSVTDTGQGIGLEQIEHIFDPFWQAKRTPDGGVGIGLAIAKRMVEAHGGRIWAESKRGVGSTFYFTIGTAATAEPESQEPLG